MFTQTHASANDILFAVIKWMLFNSSLTRGDQQFILHHNTIYKCILKVILQSIPTEVCVNIQLMETSGAKICWHKF